MIDIALRRLHLIAVPAGDGLRSTHRAAWLAELARIGFRVTNPEVLGSTDPAMLADRAQLIATLTAMKGGDVDYVPLFTRFPDDVPDDAELLTRRIIGYLGREWGAWDQPPAWLFDLGDYGADPITQFQTEQATELGRLEQQHRDADHHVEWTDVQLVTPDEAIAQLRSWLHGNLYAKSSIKEALRDDLRALLTELGVGDIDADRLVFKENRTFVARHLWLAGELDALAALRPTPTDVLRLFAALTDSDTSLASKMRFPKLTRAQRRFVLGCLERSPQLAEDLLRYEGLWKTLGRYLHPTEHQRWYPRTAEAFDALRNGRIRTFESTTQALITTGDVHGLLAHLAPRPGRLGRCVHEILRRFPDATDATLAALAEAGPKLAFKNLLVLRSYFSAINDLERRTVITKRGRIKVLPNNARGALDDAQLAAVREQVDTALADQLTLRSPWDGTAWLDPRLDRLTVPLQQRAASDGLLTLGRGSRLSIDLDAVLRLFVWWKQSARTTDLDLSAIQFDADFNYLGHVSYTQLKAEGMAHSGDLQSAPHGAAEFIDLRLAALPAEVAYVASCIYRYAGESFVEADCHAGWMVRHDVNADIASFDVKTVQHKFDVSGVGAYCVPVVIDVRRGEAVLTDLYVGSKAFHNRVEESHSSVGTMVAEVARFTSFRPTLGDLVRLHATSRGARIVADRDQATRTFGIDSSCTFDLTHVGKILSELL